jgi:hypothetical protein
MDISTTDPAREARLARERELAKQKRDRQRQNPLAYSTGLAILSAVGRYHYLSIEQVMRLHEWKSEPNVSTWLKHLTAGGYLSNENFVPVGSFRPPLYWSLRQRGRLALEDQGFPVRQRIHHDPKRKSWWLEHVRDLNDFLIQFELLMRVEQDTLITSFFHDLELQRRAVKLTFPDGSEHRFVPDAFIALRRNGMDDELCFCLEMDRGTERDAGRPWKEKIRAYVAFAKGPYQALFGRDRLTVLIAVRSHHQPDERRLADLLRWTEEELLALGLKSWGKMFFFTTLHADEVDPKTFFGADAWIRPFEKTRAPLLEGVA